MAVAPPEQVESVPVLGVRVDVVTMGDTLDLLDRFIRVGGPHHVVTLDASMCVMARDDAALAEIVRGADLVTPDSAGVLWACRRAGRPLPGRVSGVEIVERLCAVSPDRGYGLYFLGAAPGVAAEAAARMGERYPGCRIVGTHDGFFSPDDEPDLIEEIAAVRPDVLCVALGIPKQEKWIQRHRTRLDTPVMIGVGGTFDVLSGRVHRAPMWMRRLCLEWLYRVCKNPRKLGKVMTLPRFVVMVLRGRRAG